MRGFTTTENDKKREIDRFPPEDFRYKLEDLLPEAGGSVADDSTQASIDDETRFENQLQIKEKANKVKLAEKDDLNGPDTKADDSD